MRSLPEPKRLHHRRKLGIFTRRRRNPTEGGTLAMIAAAVLGGIALLGPRTQCEIDAMNGTPPPGGRCDCIDPDQVKSIGCWIRTNPVAAAGLAGVAILLWKMR